MVIQHNIQAFNANRMLGINNRKLSGSTEKMASGYKINRAADDAAGLAISEKMRKRIRGLDKGMENVEDGISLCQIADGALNEATELIQRIRELSIQAYNGTNSKSDRQTIQEEIDQSIQELDRTFETAKFNETSIFQNGKRVQGAIFNAREYTVKRNAVSYRTMPNWLKVNDGQGSKIEVNPGYTMLGNQDMSGIMQHDFKLSNGTTAKIYFGNKTSNNGGYQWFGDFIKNPNTFAYKELMARKDFRDYRDNHIDNNGNYTGWTKEITDNVAAKLDFKEYSQITDATELYSKLSDLVGVEIGFPCGTCARPQAIRFGGTFDGIDGVSFENDGTSFNAREINLSTTPFSFDGKTYNGYFEAITDVMAMEDTDPNKATKTTALADSIAKSLAQSSYNTLNSIMSGQHFDRAVKDQNDPYSVYVYDYRDADAIALTNASADSSIRTTGRVRMTYEETIHTGYYTYFDRWDGDQIWIQASDETPDGLSILDRHLSAEGLGLGNYRIDTYRTEVTMDDPEGYRKKLAEWVAAAPEPVVTSYQKEVTTTVMTKPAEYKYWTEIVAGEERKFSKLISPAQFTTQKTMQTFYVTTYPNDTRGPKPKPTYKVREIYNPSDLKLVDNALETISKVRSYYGAVQNRLEHTYNNNYNAMENMTYAESQLRDTDMAEETVRKSMLDILQQAGFSMLSQANQSKQGVSMLLS